MDREALLRRLQATFLEELAEHVETLDSGLVALEKDPQGVGATDLLTRLFRAAHSLKGAARAVDAQPIERACHRIEEILAGARDQKAVPSAETFSLLLATTDAIREAGARMGSGRSLEESPLSAALSRLEPSSGSAPVAEPEATPAAAPAPSPAEEPLGAEPVSTTAVEARPRAEESATVRVSAAKLDSLLTRSGELLVARYRVTERPREIGAVRGLLRRCRELPPVELRDTIGRVEKEFDRLARMLTADAHMIEQVAIPLEEEIRRVRMLPFAEACQGLERAVRDLARTTGKEVDVELGVSDVELDRGVIERLRDPLLHIVRNAVDHGIEPPDVRQASGKPRHGRVTVGAALRGAEVEIVVADDGKGIDLDGLRQQVRRRKLKEPSDPRELARLIFLPGLSTAPIVTDLSGRGVGLDVVKSHVESLHGSVDVNSRSGEGTRFTLKVPLTLTILRALLVKVGGQVFAFASNNVHRLLRSDQAPLTRIEGNEMVVLAGRPIPLMSLAATLDLGAPAAPGKASRALVVIDPPGEQRMAFAVEEFLAEQDILVKNLGRRIRDARNFSGATILSSGEIALLVNAGELVRSALRRDAGPVAGAGAARSTAGKRLILAEDSVTTRSLEKAILESAGYDVTAFADGEAAWQVLQEKGADLVVTDIEMPRMDGFTLTARIRASERFRDLPVVLVTSRESDADKAHGIEVGANAYLVKSAFDQSHLLETIAQLL